MADGVIRANVLDVDAHVSSALAADDVPFTDGSHWVFDGTDATRVLLEIPPALPPGVPVHARDVCLPFEYTELFTERMYNEQYLLACLILYSHDWSLVLLVHCPDRKGYFDDLREPGWTDTSFWTERRAPGDRVASGSA